jgi:hypothetical protein
MRLLALPLLIRPVSYINGLSAHRIFFRVFPPYFPSPENVLNAAFNYAPLAQLDRALASGAKGQWFDSTVAY